MKINFNTLNFKGATLNINAFSDAHGQLENIGDFYGTIKQNEKDLFLKDAAGSKNVNAIAGDWYMAGNVEGYLSKPHYNSQRFQLIFFNKLIQELKHFSRQAVTIFTPGNHDFDAGFEEFKNSVEKMDANIVATNIDFENSDESIKNRILKSYTVEIQDDKNPDLFHKALFLGILPSNMSYYNKKLTGISFLDNVFKPQSKLTEEDIQNTLKALKREIENFKRENPKGAIILLDHFGGIFRKEVLAQNLPIDIILGGHEHLDYNEIANNSVVAMLYQNFKKLQNIKLNFDDDGDVISIKTRAYYPQNQQQTNAMQKFYETVFKEDIETKFEIPASDDTAELNLKGIRYQNSPLANYITDVILNRIRKKYPKTDFFALNASAIRGPLKTKNSGSINNLNLLLTLNGIRHQEANIVISKLTGEQILDIIIENLLTNSQNMEKNPLLHFSGLKIDKTLLLQSLPYNIAKKDLIKYVRKTDTNEPLELDRTYTLANVEKFFLKSKNPVEKEIYKSKYTIKTGLNAKDEFRAHFVQNLKEVQASSEIRIN